MSRVLVMFSCLIIASCGGGGGDSKPKNKLPTVSVTAVSQVDEGTFIELTAIANDSDGSVISYRWEQISGITLSLSGATSPTLSVTMPQVEKDEEVSLRVTVEDDDGANASETTTILVKNVVPVSLRAIDGYLENAVVWLDVNSNSQLDDLEPSSLTNELGEAGFDVYSSDLDNGFSFIVFADPSTTVDKSYGALVAHPFFLTSPRSEMNITPLTTLVQLDYLQNRNIDAEHTVAISEEYIAGLLKIEKDLLYIDYIGDSNAELAYIAENVVNSRLLPSSAAEFESIRGELPGDSEYGKAIVKALEAIVRILDSADANGLEITKLDPLYLNVTSNCPQDYVASDLSRVCVIDTDGDDIGDDTDIDVDNDGFLNFEDEFPFDDSEWLDTDGDGIGNNADADDDNDGVDDTLDVFPQDPAENSDFDRDGIGDNSDTDANGDGIEDVTQSTVQLFSNRYAFAALKRDGSVEAWQYDYNDVGGNISGVYYDLQDGIVDIVGDGGSFAAIKYNESTKGSVVMWGTQHYDITFADVSDRLQADVRKVYANSNAFAALKDDGSVVVWGAAYSGGDSSLIQNHLQSGVVAIFPSSRAFAALKSDGSVVTWGDSQRGGDSTVVADELASGVVDIFPAPDAFLALKDNGSLVVWGGNSREDQLGSFEADDGVEVAFSSVSDQLTRGVVRAFSGGDQSYAALKADGSVVTWGGRYNCFDGTTYEPCKGAHTGANASDVALQLSGQIKVVDIVNSGRAWHALREDGSVVSWGSGFPNPSQPIEITNQLSSGVVAIYGDDYSMAAALKQDGSVVTWSGRFSYEPNIAEVASALTSDVVEITSAYLGLMAALKNDGSVVVWSNQELDLDNAAWLEDALTVPEEAEEGVVSVVGAWGAFAALKEDGSVVTWGRIDQPNSPTLSGRTLPYIDTDMDGVLNSVESNCDLKNALNRIGENTRPCLSPGLWDSDGDGVRDGFELKYGGNPLNQDSDFDLDNSNFIYDGSDAVQDLDASGKADSLEMNQ